MYSLFACISAVSVTGRYYNPKITPKNPQYNFIGVFWGYYFGLPPIVYIIAKVRTVS